MCFSTCVAYHIESFKLKVAMGLFISARVQILNKINETCKLVSIMFSYYYEGNSEVVQCRKVFIGKVYILVNKTSNHYTKKGKSHQQLHRKCQRYTLEVKFTRREDQILSPELSAPIRE